MSTGPESTHAAQAPALVGAAAEPHASAARSPMVPDPPVTMTRSEERLTVSASEWRPYHRLRFRKVIRTEQVTTVVTVRREELVVDEQAITAVERLEAAFGSAGPPPPEDADVVLHREECIVQTRVVPYERVHVGIVAVTEDWPIKTELRRERIEVERVSVDER